MSDSRSQVERGEGESKRLSGLGFLALFLSSAF